MSNGEPNSSSEPVDVHSKVTGSKQAMAASREAGSEENDPSVLNTREKPETPQAPRQQVDADESASLSVESASRTDEAASPIALKPVSVSKHVGFFEERSLPVVEMDPNTMRHRTRREVLAFGIGVVAMATGAGYLLPQNTLNRLGVRRDLNSRGKERLLNNALRVDDDVAEALYSQNRMVPTYTRSQITPIKNNYNGSTPEPWYISGWNLTLDGLASRLSIRLDIRTLMRRFSVHDQITRFVCVEGWSAIAWWAGLRFDDLLRAYPPRS